ELDDACAVISWIAAQDWCNGSIGMMGISWGGFNSLQVAAMQPPALKAVISLGSTVDRYNDDIHYKNGCLLASNFNWSAVMLCYASRPPDPALVGERWKDMWLHRLNTQPFPLESWLQHQHKDEYWKHGSISEDYSAVKIPALVISGWADGYHNAPPAAVRNLQTKSKAINGPWIHKYPHFAWPKPRMDFLNEAIQWWDCWLKGIDNQAQDLPAYRAYISENVQPQLRREYEPGRWVAAQTWPCDNTSHQAIYPAPNHQLLDAPVETCSMSICSPLDCGTASGEYFTLKPESELAGDQRIDDAGSLVFDTPELDQAVEILGRPVLRLKITVDRPQANIIARLSDVHTSGAVNRVSWGVLNLSHRHGNENPAPMSPGKTETIEITLDECGYRFLSGHKIRLAISTNYWPMVMPPPEIVTATIESGAETKITLPVRPGGDRIDIAEPENPEPLPVYTAHSPAQSHRWITRDLQAGATHYNWTDDTGESEMPKHGLRTRHFNRECWSVSIHDPLSCRATSEYISWMSRDKWSVRTEAESSFSCDRDNFYITATVTAYESDRQVSQRAWNKTIKRNLI
ncbi:MAG: CocE/NonD family hydrolase, partial [Gammaproteobacteria bacterium]|nr:CocE/NonD family hydrolase [Gammaproteobacteria bacterium]